MRTKMATMAISVLLIVSLVSALQVGAASAQEADYIIPFVVTQNSGQNEINKEAGHPYITWTIDGNEITFDFHNPLGSDYACAFDYRVDGEPGTRTDFSDIVVGGTGELAGQEIGLSYNIVNVGAETETRIVTASKEVQVGLRLQSESDWDLDWIVFAPDPELESLIDTLEGQVASLETQLAQKDVEISSLNSQIVSLNEQIEDLQSRIDELETVDITNLEKQVDALEAEISSLNAQISRLEASGISDASTISALRRECNELEKDLKYWKNRPRSTRVITTGGIGEDGGQVVFAVTLGIVGIVAMLCVKSFTGTKKSKKG